MLSRTIVLLIASLTMTNQMQGTESVSTAPETPVERKLVYEGMADAGRIRLELWTNGAVGARYDNHPRAKAKDQPWAVQVQFQSKRIAAIIDKAVQAVQQAAAKGVETPSLLQPGMDLTLKSISVVDLQSKKVLVELSFLETPPDLASTIKELHAVYLESKNARKPTGSVKGNSQ